MVFSRKGAFAMACPLCGSTNISRGEERLNLIERDTTNVGLHGLLRGRLVLAAVAAGGWLLVQAVKLFSPVWSCMRCGYSFTTQDASVIL